jgi:hypothetical protein
MREDVVTPATARRLQRAGLAWDPQLGDWCTVLGGEHLGEAQPGLWLVAALAPAAGLVGVMDAAGQWPMARVPARDCCWLPSAGKLKMWLRARGYRIATAETDPVALGAGARHVCRLARPGDPTATSDGEGPSESEAVAEAVLGVLARSVRREEGVSDDAGQLSAAWLPLHDVPTRRF